MGKKKTWNVSAVLFVLSIMMAFCISLPVRAAGEAVKYFTADSQFEINAQGMITQYKGNDKEVVIPTAVNSVAVKGLMGTFKDNTTIEKVIVPDTLETIGDNTFNGCTGLNAMCVYNPAIVKTKEELEAEKPYDRWENYIADGDYGYYEIIDKGSCIVIPTGLKTIGNYVFNSCRFVSFDVLEGNTAFVDSGEGGLNLDNGVGACLMSYDKSKLYKLASNYGSMTGTTGQYDLPVGIKEILPYAMHKTDMKKIVVPTTVEQIDAYAFYEAGSLEEIIFAETSRVTTIGECAFAYNTNLTIALPPSVTTIGVRCFAYISNRTPDISQSSITVLPAYTFEGCDNLHTIEMPKTLRVIEGYAFAGTDNLNEVIFLGDTLDKIEKGAFQDCQNLHIIKIPEGVKAIEDDTFAGCTNLNTVVLPDSLESIGDNSFGGCQNIHEMVIPPNVKHISKDTFKGVDPDRLSGVDTSKNTLAQKMIKKALPKKGYTTTIGNLKYKVTKSHATKGTVTVVSAKNKKQKTISIPSTVNINGYTFKVTAISNNAFKKNTKLTSVTIGANVKTIGKEAFSGCKKLKKITVKSKVVSKVNAKAFKGIHKKAKIKLPKMSSSKFKKYKKKFAKKGQASTVKITK